MRPSPPEPDLRQRVESLVVGARLTFAIAVIGLAYVALTWERPHRPAILGAGALACLVGVGLERLPLEPLLRSRWREPFFQGWSGLSLLAVGASAVADGGVRSPLALGLFLPLIFAATSYPVRSLVVVAVLDLAVFAGVALITEEEDAPFLLVFAACLVLTAVMGASLARNAERHRRELDRLSRADPLTGVLNRRGYQERVDAELTRARRDGTRLGVVVIDLDGFKGVNDTLGHAAGDELLRWAAEAMTGVVRPADVVGRLGGDEFAVALPGAGAEEVATAAERVRSALARRTPASVGTACHPRDGGDRDALHRHADAELYAAKRGAARAGTGRGSYA